MIGIVIFILSFLLKILLFVDIRCNCVVVLILRFVVSVSLVFFFFNFFNFVGVVVNCKFKVVFGLSLF